MKDSYLQNSKQTTTLPKNQKWKWTTAITDKLNFTMGIHFLQTYLEKEVPEACVNINIIEACHATSRSNTLIIDLMAMVICFLISIWTLLFRVIFQIGKSYEGLNYFSGGDFAAFKCRWKGFLQKCEHAGVKLIFVCDGVSLQTKRQTWIRRRYSSMNNFVLPAFDALKKHEYPPDDILLKSRVLPCLMLVHYLR